MDVWYFTSKIYVGMTFKVQPFLLNLGTLKGSKIILRTFKDPRLPCNREHPRSSQHYLMGIVHCLHCVLTLAELSFLCSCSVVQ